MMKLKGMPDVQALMHVVAKLSAHFLWFLKTVWYRVWLCPNIAHKRMLFLFILNLCQHLIFKKIKKLNTGNQFCFQAAFVCLFSLLVNAETAKCSHIYSQYENMAQC